MRIEIIAFQKNQTISPNTTHCL